MARQFRRFALPAALLLIIAGGVVAGLMGVRLYRVDSGSMRPTLPVGTIVLVVPTDELHERDIVTMRVNGKVVTHTFGWEAPRGDLVTKGDANPDLDNFTPAPRRENVIGVVWRQIPVSAPEFWMTWNGRVLMVVVALLLLLWLCPTKEDSARERRQTNPTPA